MAIVPSNELLPETPQSLEQQAQKNPLLQALEGGRPIEQAMDTPTNWEDAARLARGLPSERKQNLRKRIDAQLNQAPTSPSDRKPSTETLKKLQDLQQATDEKLLDRGAREAKPYLDPTTAVDEYRRLGATNPTATMVGTGVVGLVGGYALLKQWAGVFGGESVGAWGRAKKLLSATFWTLGTVTGVVLAMNLIKQRRESNEKKETAPKETAGGAADGSKGLAAPAGTSTPEGAYIDPVHGFGPPPAHVRAARGAPVPDAPYYDASPSKRGPAPSAEVAPPPTEFPPAAK